MNRTNRGALAALALVLAFTAVFVVLSVDVAVRVWDWRAKFESMWDVAVLLYLESTRTVVTSAGIVLAVLAVRRAARVQAFSHMAFGIAFATLFYTKAIAYRDFPGALQGAAATWLRAHDVPGWLMRVLFDQPEWAAWPALAGLLAFASAWPRRLTAVDIAASGAADRQGALREVPLAGTDIGGGTRVVAARLIERGALRPSVLWVAGLSAGALHTLLLLAMPEVRLLINVGFIAAAAAVFAILVALLRAGHHVADDRERRLYVWLRRGGLLAAALFAGSALSAFFTPGSAIGMVLLSLAPAVLAVCLALALAAIERSPGAATVSVPHRTHG